MLLGDKGHLLLHLILILTYVLCNSNHNKNHNSLTLNNINDINNNNDSNNTIVFDEIEIIDAIADENMIIHGDNFDKNNMKVIPETLDQITILNENIINLSATNATPSDNLSQIINNQNNLSTSNLDTPTTSITNSKLLIKSQQKIAINNSNKSSSVSLNAGAMMRPTQSIVASTVIVSNLSSTSNSLKVPKTNAPMLNYIYDAHLSSNKHYHHDHRYGPHFEDMNSQGNITNVTVQAGNTAFLNCRISLLQDKTVSWVRRKHDGDDLQLLTVGLHTYSGDSRYTVEMQYPNNWRLKISYANKRDEGLYECQISTHPPKVIQFFLKVNAPEVTIVDEHGFPLLDKYYEVDSTIQLTCNVRFISMTSSVVFWLHGNRTLNYDITRGGISVKTDLMDNGANSVLFIAKVNKSDSGNYTCSIGGNTQFTTLVHVLNEESLAELYHGGTNNFLSQKNCYNLNLLLATLFILSNLHLLLHYSTYRFYSNR